MVLSGSITSCTAAVETYSHVVGTVVIRRQPIRAGIGNITPGFRSVMMSPCKDMMQAERHHVVYYCFSRFLKHLEVEKGEFSVDLLFLNDFSCRSIGLRTGNGKKSLFQPFFSYLFGRERMFPCQSSESIPVGLSKRMSTPISIITDVCHSGNSRERMKE